MDKDLMYLLLGLTIAFIGALISFFEKWNDNRKDGKKNSYNISSFIILTIGVIITLISGIYSNKSKQESDSIAKANQKKLEEKSDSITHLQISTKDSIIKKVDVTYTNSIKASNDALAKYHLKITDSLHSVISKLKLNALNPQLSIAPEGEGYHTAYLTRENGKNVLLIQLVSKGGTSHHILVNAYFINDSPLGPTILKKDQLSFGENFITEDIKSTVFIDIEPDLLFYSKVTVFLTGTFSKDSEGKMIVQYNNAFDFNFKENKFISKIDADFGKLKKILKIDN